MLLALQQAITVDILERDGDILIYVPEEVFSDKDAMLKIVGTRAYAYEYISDSEMFDIIKNPDIEEPAKLLLDMANNAGGKDNITVVTVEG